MSRTGDFFPPLGFLLRQRIPLLEALELLARDMPELRNVLDRLSQGASFSSALSGLGLPKDLIPLLDAVEAQGLPPEQLEALAAWPDATGPNDLPVARVFVHASILLQEG